MPTSRGKSLIVLIVLSLRSDTHNTIRSSWDVSKVTIFEEMFWGSTGESNKMILLLFDNGGDIFVCSIAV